MPVPVVPRALANYMFSCLNDFVTVWAAGALGGHESAIVLAEVSMSRTALDQSSEYLAFVLQVHETFGWGCGRWEAVCNREVASSWGLLPLIDPVPLDFRFGSASGMREGTCFDEDAL